MENEDLLVLLRKANLQQTSTLAVKIAQNLDTGVKLADNGACKAVVLRLNNFARNSVNGTQVTATYFYWGDNQRQEFEVLRGVNSQVIFCSNLSEVQVRCPFNEEVFIQVMVYN